MNIEKIYIGGWFQRTTLHLTELWDFLKYNRSNLDFSPEELSRTLAALDIVTVSRESGPLEYILVQTRLAIAYRIYEDGLIILEKDFHTVKEDFQAIRDYYEYKLSPAISLIFSKGAPVPKELANIKTILPYILLAHDGTKEDIEELFKNSSEDIYSVLSTKQTEVYRSSGIILINNLQDQQLAREIIESEIFFREFKSQLHRYLAIHRNIWEKIAKIKERGEVRGPEIDRLRGELGDYQKTIGLIGARIDQMGSYLRTRQKITDSEKIDAYLNPLFQFKFETLQNTHEYIRDLWSMTKNYLDSAIEMFTELQAKSTKNTISSLQLVTTIGVVAGILGYLGKDKWPDFTFIGIIYFILLMAMTWALNMIVSRYYKNQSYSFKGAKIVNDIK